MKIGELARVGPCTVETVRYYEKKGLLAPPARTPANYRSYGSAHVYRLRFIRNCRALDMTHEEIHMLLGLMDQPAGDCGGVNQLLDEHIAHVEVRIAELCQLKQQLRPPLMMKENSGWKVAGRGRANFWWLAPAT